MTLLSVRSGTFYRYLKTPNSYPSLTNTIIFLDEISQNTKKILRNVCYVGEKRTKNPSPTRNEWVGSIL